ncbi:hypothetical protein V2I01_20140 [Micromonospora sp. BRA006-A]|nr:hypothetical protein [Micromonospora sp. BRA006-A]
MHSGRSTGATAAVATAPPFPETCTGIHRPPDATCTRTWSARRPSSRSPTAVRNCTQPSVRLRTSTATVPGGHRR